MSEENSATKQADSPCERLGGEDVIFATLEAFYVSVPKDEELKPLFAKSNISSLDIQEELIAEVVSAVTLLAEEIVNTPSSPEKIQ